MNADFNYFEKQVAQKVKQVKPKSKQRGYAKKLVAKMFTVIEESLNGGCDYDDIATAISETNVKISPSTLRRYHLANRKELGYATLPQQEVVDESSKKAQIIYKQHEREKILPLISREQNNQLQTQATESTSHEREPSKLVDRLRLSDSSLSDADFFDSDDDPSDFVKPYIRRGN